MLAPAAFSKDPEPRSLSIAALQDQLSPNQRAILSFRIEGVVCATAPERNLIALQDATAAILLELPAAPAKVRAGDRLAVTGVHCAIDQDRFETHLGTMPTVDIDGVHAAETCAGQVYLTPGLQPIRLLWFNAVGVSALRLEYESRGRPRRKIPDEALWRKPPGAGGFQPGLDFAAYTCDHCVSVASLERSNLQARGVALNFDRHYSVRPEQAGLIFSGYLTIPEAGIYTFQLESDDGGRLYVGDPGTTCQVLTLQGPSAPAPSLEQALVEQYHAHWVETEGMVTFAAADAGNLELDLDWKGQRLRATVLDGAPLLSSCLMRRHIRIAGLCEAFRDLPVQSIRLTVPSPSQVDFKSVPSASQDLRAGARLNAARQVRDLPYQEAERHLPVTIQGIVTYSIEGVTMLQDATGGVFVLTGMRLDHPAIGDLWEVEGHTEGGGFAPQIRASKMRLVAHASLPEPIHATWDQLMNGSLDEQYIEIEGVLIAATDAELTLLTRSGNITICDHVNYPLPRLLTPASQAAGYIGSLLRIRGALSVKASGQTRRAVPGIIRLGSALVSVETPRPLDPFSLPTKKAADLRLFDPRASAFQRTKLAGQIIGIRPGQAFMLEGKTGIRLVAREFPPLRPGDHVEAVGFPDISGPSPALHDTQVRTTGKAALPDPITLGPKELLDRGHDAQLARVEATLLSDTPLQGEHVLELQAESCRFLGRVETRQALDQLRIGNRLQLVGVYSWGAENRSPASPAGFELLLNDAAAITVLQRSPWWTEQRILAAAGTLATALSLAAVWIALLRRKVGQRTAQWQKEVEQRQLAEQRRAVELERVRVAQDLHDELGTGLTQVSLLGELVKNPVVSAECKQGYLEQLTDAARSLVTGLDEIVWAVNPKNDSVASLANYYELFAQRFLNLAGIGYRLEIAEPLPDYPLDSRVRHGIFLAFKEALNNIVRHSGATEVRSCIQVAREHFMLSLTDNGCGFDVQTAAPGADGLANMRRRMQDLGGDCDIDSSAGRGARVQFSLPIEKPRP